MAETGRAARAALALAVGLWTLPVALGQTSAEQGANFDPSRGGLDPDRGGLGDRKAHV